MLVRLLPLVSVPCTNKLHIRGLTILAAFRFFSLTLPSSSCVLSPVARRPSPYVCRLSSVGAAPPLHCSHRAHLGHRAVTFLNS